MFAVELDPDDTAGHEYINATRSRLKGSLIKSPFTGWIHSINNLHILNVKPVYPNLSALMVFPGMTLIFFWGFTWVRFASFLLLGLFAIMGYVHTDIFQYEVCKKGLKKAGYKGTVRRVPMDELVRGLIGHVPE